MKILYLTCLENTCNNSIHYNQVLSLSKNRNNIQYYFLFISPLLIINRNGFKLNRSKLDNKNCIEYKIPLLSYNFYLSPILLPLLCLISLPLLLYQILRIKPDLIHCRNMLSTLIAILCKMIFSIKIKIICDPRSVYVEEGVIIKRWKYNKISYKLWKKIESWTYRHSNACLGLSESFKKYLSTYNENSYYVPAIVNDKFNFNKIDRIFFRAQWKLTKEDTVLIYVGSIGLWHDILSLIDIIKYCKNKTTNKSIKLFLLSNSKDLEKKMLENFTSEEILFIGTVAPNKLKNYLVASDYGLVPGSNSNGYHYDLLYRTMISSKAEEYLCAGLPIIVNSRIKSLADLVTKNNCGLLYNFNNTSLSFDSLRVFDRNNISISAGNFFLFDRIMSQYIEIYNIVLNKKNK